MRNILRSKLLGFGSLFIVPGLSFAQKVVSSYNNETEISAPTSVTLTNGFYVPAGHNLRVFTTGVTFQNCIPLASAPSSNQNYILTRTFKVAGVTASTIGNSRNLCEENQVVQYLDGLGRPLQMVTVQGSPTGADLIQPFAYDAYGRESQKFLPYSATTNGGAYRADALQAGAGLMNFYNPAGSSQTSGEQLPTGWVRIPTPYSTINFEASPLNRVVEQGAPGDAWQPVAGSTAGHTMKMLYGTNAANEVKLWTISAGGGTTAAFYAAGTLYRTTSMDENWTSGTAGTVEEYKDLEGRVVLKRLYSATTALNTYYIYDDLGNLRYVVPPAVTANSFTESDTSFSNFIYGYHYDGRKRLIEKKIPGKGWEFMVYNKLDQLVLSQDANQNAQPTKEWMYTKYDALGRVVMTGIFQDQGSRSTLQTAVDGISILWESRNATDGSYTNVAYPTSSTNVQTINYYDNYSFPGNSFGNPNGTTEVNGDKVKGLLTGTLIKVIGTSNMLLSVNFYDKEARITKSLSQHYLSGAINTSNYDEVNNTYNFAGELTNSVRIHHTTGGDTNIANRYEYDHMGRKLATFENINNQSVETILSKLEYNELGQLKTKKLHSTNGTGFMQQTELAYNERGWLKNSNSDQFSYALKYNDASSPSLAQYNGNIANQVWGSVNGKISVLPNRYDYVYDPLNRLTNASSTGISMSEALTYDMMGNITSLNRDGSGANAYSYNGNQLTSVAGVSTTNYAYDANGNATTDGRNGMALTYNYLNLPAIANKTGTSLAYTYDAAGNKLQKNANGSVRNYIKGIEYNGSTIDVIHTEEGVAQNNGGTYSYHYNLTDHLGNVRYSFDIYNNALRRLQEDNYYAFGKRQQVSPVSGNNKYLYNGKEVQDELGEQYDYGARFYDPIIGRWNVVDPLAEKFFRVNPYNYADNNPTNNIDPDGMDVVYGANSTTYTGLDAQSAFAQIKSQYSNRQDDPDEPKKKQPTSSLGQSFINGIKSGLDDTWQGIKSQFTIKGYLETEANIFSLGMYGSIKMMSGGYEIAKNIPNYSANDYAFGAGFVTEKVAEYYLTGKALSKANYALEFNLNDGWGLFGKKGLNIGNYKIEALYRNASGEGGTYLSIKEAKKSGNLVRWDLGASHTTGQMGYHSTFRFNINEKTYGSSGQYPASAPFQFWKYKQK